MYSTMTPKTFQAAALLADLAVAQRDNDIEKVKTLVTKVNELDVISMSEVSLNSIFNPNWTIINESFFYIVDNIAGFYDRAITKFLAQIQQLRQNGNRTGVINFIQSLIDNPNQLDDINLTIVTSLISLCLDFQLFDLLGLLKNVFQQKGLVQDYDITN